MTGPTWLRLLYFGLQAGPIFTTHVDYHHENITILLTEEERIALEEIPELLQNKLIQTPQDQTKLKELLESKV